MCKMICNRASKKFCYQNSKPIINLRFPMQITHSISWNQLYSIWLRTSSLYYPWVYLYYNREHHSAGYRQNFYSIVISSIHQYFDILALNDIPECRGTRVSIKKTSKERLLSYGKMQMIQYLDFWESYIIQLQVQIGR